MSKSRQADFSELVGKTLTSIIDSEDREQILFITTDGDCYKQFHYQDCCEDVLIEDVCGDLNDLIGVPITRATKDTSHDMPLEGETLPDMGEYQEDSYTWTFYRIGTVKGSVTIRWYGTSNGYYSEEVDFILCERSEQ